MSSSQAVDLTSLPTYELCGQAIHIRQPDGSDLLLRRTAVNTLLIKRISQQRTFVTVDGFTVFEGGESTAQQHFDWLAREIFEVAI